MLSALSLPAGQGRVRRPMDPRAVPLGSGYEQGYPCSTRSAVSIYVCTYSTNADFQPQLGCELRQLRG